MNMAFREVFGDAKPTLPLQSGGNIVCGNATRLDWEVVCPKDAGHETYILGNPPYLGARMQNAAQKADMAFVLGSLNGFNNLDYIACWFKKSAEFIKEFNGQYAFVSTNSIVQGEQAGILWSGILINLEIGFAYKSFKWANNAKGNAGVTCVIVGVRNKSTKEKFIWEDHKKIKVSSINSYLTDSCQIAVNSRNKPLSNLKNITFGSMANDGGFFFLDEQEQALITKKYPCAQPFIRKALGSKEFINSINRFCIWVSDEEKLNAITCTPIAEKINKVKIHREGSERNVTKKLAATSHRFAEIRHIDGNAIIIPSVSSERRFYIPVGFLTSESNVIITNLAFAVYDPPTWIFAVISSRMHMTWVRAVAGRLETRIRYSSSLCYNTFPFPEISDKQKEKLEDHVFRVLDEREKHPEKTMAQLYDPDKMPAALRQAHHDMDIAIEQCYRAKPFTTDEERLEYLFTLYEEMIAKEKARG